jgi:hypothetical protein
MDGWSVALLAVAGYVAVTTLVRLMIGHRNQMILKFRRKLKSAGTPEKTEAGGLGKREKKKAA